MIEQTVVFDYPPLYADIVEALPVGGKSGVIFSWGDLIYNPDREPIPAELLAHEAVHGERQLGDVEGWWRRYLEDVNFRFDEELLAHRAEYAHVMENGNRHQRRQVLKRTARRLAAPLYGQLIDARSARSLLTYEAIAGLD